MEYDLRIWIYLFKQISQIVHIYQLLLKTKVIFIAVAYNMKSLPYFSCEILSSMMLMFPVTVTHQTSKKSKW